MKNNNELIPVTNREQDGTPAVKFTRDDSRYSAFVENAIEGIWRIDFTPPISLDAPVSKQNKQIFENGVYTEANDAAAQIYGLNKGTDVIGRALTEFMQQSDAKNIERIDEFVENRFLMKNLLTYEMNTGGETRCVVNNITPHIQDNQVHYIWGASLDITELMDLQEELEISRKELAIQKKALEEKNAALKELITHIELDKKDFKERVVANIDQVILPSLDKISSTNGNVDQVEHIRRALEDLTSSFGMKVSDRTVKLTPREIEVCNLVKNGLSSKEISRMLKIALHTVEKHRRTARKKLGLTRQGVNLQSHLNSL